MQSLPCKQRWAYDIEISKGILECGFRNAEFDMWVSFTFTDHAVWK